MATVAIEAARKISSGLFTFVFPDTCRVCDAPLTEVSRIPVCSQCLANPQPFIAEYFCVSCHTPFVNEFPLDDEGRCGLCRRGLTGFDDAWSYGAYEGTLRELIQLFKYGKVQTLARPFGEWLSLALPRDRAFDLVVPMPMHWRRRWNRGFNQAELLAAEIGRRTGIKVKNVVNRRKATPPQAGLSSAKRRQNVSGAFRVSRPAGVADRRILLVDDVLTIGATAAACARTLKRAGARHVSVLTLARADRRFHAEALKQQHGPSEISLAPTIGSN